MGSGRPAFSPHRPGRFLCAPRLRVGWTSLIQNQNQFRKDLRNQTSAGEDLDPSFSPGPGLRGPADLDLDPSFSAGVQA